MTKALRFPFRCLVLLFVIGAPLAAMASSPRIVVVVASPTEEAMSFEASVRELLGRLRLEVSMERIETTEGAPAPVAGEIQSLVDLTLSGEAVVRTWDVDGAEAERRIPQVSTRAILIDETAHVVQAAVESLVSEPPPAAASTTPAAAAPLESVEPLRMAAASQPAASPGASPPKPTASPERSPWSADLGAFLGAHTVNEHAPFVPGVGAGLQGAYRRGTVHPGAWLLFESRFDFDVTEGPAAPRAHTMALRLLPTIDVVRREQWALQASLGGGIDRFVVIHAIEDREGDAEVNRRSGIRPAITGMLGFRITIVENVQLTALALADFDPDPPNLEVRHREPEPTRPWMVVPGLLVGVSFTPMGSEPMP